MTVPLQNSVRAIAASLITFMLINVRVTCQYWRVNSHVVVVISGSDGETVHADSRGKQQMIGFIPTVYIQSI